ncbi:MAG: PEP-CTERM sorting domain-containing protein [Planctomycetota bacterium]
MFTLLAVASLAVPVNAATIDGTVDASYGGALAVQTVETGFGDNASEWNAGYATLSGGRLNLMLTGNLENNFNKLNIFIDSAAGGQSVFASAGNDNSGNMDGLVFDTPFTADYHLIVRRGSSKLDVDFADLGAATFNFYEDVFGGADFGAGMTGTGVNALPIDVAYDGSNAAGIGGGNGVAADQNAALAVTTGLELSIALSDLGYVPGSGINIMVAQNGGSHDFMSNQILGGLPAGTANLGGDGAGNFTGTSAIDFTAFAGDQFFTVVPEPASAGLVLAGLALVAARRR